MKQGKTNRAQGFFAFEDLDIYALALDFAAAIYAVSAHFPASERYGLTDQIRRASTSVALNIAEGRGRGTDKDFARFLWQARASAYECVSALHLAERLSFVQRSETAPLLAQAQTLCSKITSLIRTLQRSFQ